MDHRRVLFAWARVALAVSGAVWLAAMARAAPARFDIPAQPAATALVEFAKQAAVEVLFSSAELKAVQANAVVGTLEPADAVARLLRGTGFVATRTAAGKFMVVRERPRASTGELRGVVLTADGEPASGATVQLEGTTRGGRTRADGTYVVRGLPEGRHALAIQLDGHALLRVADVDIPAGRRTELGPVKLARARPQQLEGIVVDANGIGVQSAPLLLELQAMIVTPSRYGIQDERGTVAATLTETDLLALPQLGDDLYRAISRLPGLAVDDLTARFWVRGAPHDQVLARLDGVDLIEPFHLKDTDSSLSILDLETISRLDLFTGGFSVEYGNRAAGVLTMETDSYAREKPRTSLGLSLTGVRGSSRGQTSNGKGRWLFSARTGYPDLAINAQEPGDSEIRPRYHDVMGKWELQLRPNHRLSLHALHARDRMLFRDADGPQLTSRYGSDYLWARWLAEVGTATGETVVSHATLSWRRTGSGLIDERHELDVRERRDLSLLALRQDWTVPVSDRLLWRAGFGATTGEADYDYHSRFERDVLSNGRFSVERIARDTRLSPDGDSLAAHGALRWQPWDGFTAEQGVRYDASSQANDKDVSPRLHVAWQRGRSAVRVAWGLYHQAQGLHQLAVPDGDGRFYASERAEHRVLSFEHRLTSGLALRLEGYDRRVHRPRPHWENVFDPVDAVSEAESDRRRLDPVAMRARGVELIAERRGGKQFAWSASYAWAKAEETLRDGSIIPRMRDQRHTIYFDATYSPNPRWQFSVAWQYHTGWPTTNRVFSRVSLAGGGTVIVSQLGPVYGIRLPDYQRLDLRIQRRFELKQSVVRAYLDVFNVLNHSNVIEYAYRAETRPDGTLATRRLEGDSLFPRLPSVGLAWDF